MGNGRDKERAIDFINDLISLYYEKRDMNTLMGYIEEDISCIGTGEGEICKNLEETAIALKEELSEYSGIFDVIDTDISYVSLSTNACVIYGSIHAVPKSDSLAREDVRFSVAIEQNHEGLKLKHIHFSHADFVQEEGKYFVYKNAKIDNKDLREKLSAKNRQLVDLFKNIPGGVHQCAADDKLTLLSMSEGFLSMFGYTKKEIDELFDGQYLNMIFPSDRVEINQITQSKLKNGESFELEYRVINKMGEVVWVLDKGRYLVNGDGKEYFYCLLLDITANKIEQEKLRLSLERHQVIVDQATDIIFEWDILKDTLDFSKNFKKKFGYEAINKNINMALMLSTNIHPDDFNVLKKVIYDIKAGKSFSESELRIRNSSGEFYWCRMRVTTQYDSEHRAIKGIGILVDIDKEKRENEYLIQQAQFDTLTGIYNKSTIQALVDQKLNEAVKNKSNYNKYHVLIILDIDHFKSVNDNFGHLCGDSILSDVAAALKSCTRSTDLVGRIGGDEFLIYLSEISNKDIVRIKAEQILRRIEKIQPEVGAPFITCSMGAVFFPSSENSFESLYQAADNALYQQKNNGRAGVTILTEKDSDAVMTLSSSLIGNPIVSDEGTVVDVWLSQYTFRMLYSAKDIEETINRLIEIIGRSFDVSRAYIFESDEGVTHCYNTFEWCSENIEPQIYNLQKIAYVDELDDYISNFNENGIFYCRNIEELHPDVYSIVKPQGIRSMLQCAMLDEGKFVGYVGFDECRENREWTERQIASFKLTADVLSTFLIKLRQKKQLTAKK